MNKLIRYFLMFLLLGVAACNKEAPRVGACYKTKPDKQPAGIIRIDREVGKQIYECTALITAQNLVMHGYTNKENFDYFFNPAEVNCADYFQTGVINHVR